MEHATPNSGAAVSRLASWLGSVPANAGIGRRQVLRAGIGSLVALGVSRAFAADPAPDAALVAAARKEGTLTVYTPSEIDMMVNWCASFTQTYGVQVKAVRGPGYPMFDRWLNEERVGRHFADVIQTSDPTLFDSPAAKGFLATYKPAADPAIYPQMKRSGTWYGLHVGYMGIGYNTHRLVGDDEAVHPHTWLGHVGRPPLARALRDHGGGVRR